MKFYKMYLMDENETFASYYQQFFCDMRMKLGVHYNIPDTKKWWALESDDPDDYDTGYFGLRSPDDILPFFAGYFPSGYLDNSMTTDRPENDIDIKEMWDFGEACDLFASFGMPVICECEGIPKDQDDSWWDNWNKGDEVEFIDETIIKVVRPISLQEIRDTIFGQYKEVK